MGKTQQPLQAVAHEPVDVKRRVFAIVAASSGNLIEWFDFYIYAFCAIYFAPHFFPQQDQTVQLLASAGVFAAGFLMRPIGSWLFGRLADRHGRKKSLVVSVMMMCFSSLVIACLPGYASIGILAPALLLLARLLQGLSVGGEYGTTATYMCEVAQQNRRGFFSSFQYVTLIGGQLLAVLVLVILQLLFSDNQLREWGWRIPFFIGAIAAVIALWLRRVLKETISSAVTRHQDAGSMRALLTKHWAAFVIVVGYTAAGSLSFYTFTTYMQKYLVNSIGMSARQASYLLACALVIFMLLQPLFGMLSDRIGRRNNMLLFSGLGALMVVPVFSLLSMAGNAWLVFGLMTLALLVISFYTSVAAIVKAEVFPPEVRALGVGVSYAVANALFGGSAEAVALYFKSIGHESVFAWYVTVMLVIAFLFSTRISREPRYLHHNDEDVAESGHPPVSQAQTGAHGD